MIEMDESGHRVPARTASVSAVPDGLQQLARELTRFGAELDAELRILREQLSRDLRDDAGQRIRLAEELGIHQESFLGTVRDLRERCLRLYSEAGREADRMAAGSGTSSAEYGASLDGILGIFRMLRERTQLFPLVLDTMIRVTHAERGFIALVSGGKLIDFKVARNFRREEIDNPGAEASRSIIMEAAAGGEPLILPDAMQSRFSQLSNTVQAKRVRSVICVPFQVSQAGSTGIIYVDNPDRAMHFTGRDLELVKSVAAAFSAALENSEVSSLLHHENRRLRDELEGRRSFREIVGESPVMREMLSRLRLTCDNDVSVMIEGETGSGKELVARAVHYESRRRSRPFVVVDCGNIKLDTWMITLFGCEDKRFTGVKKQIGKFQFADGGTVFLDEISSLPLELQPFLLRVLQDRQIWPEGANQGFAIDVRIVAATNQPLHELVTAGRFREDLYYRLAQIPIRVPPLRERRSDIPLLVSHYLERCSWLSRSDRPVPAFSPAATRRLQQHDWPGNVRELQRCIDNTILFAGGKERIEAEDVVFIPVPGAAVLPPASACSPSISAGDVLDSFERRELNVLQDHSFSFTNAVLDLNNREDSAVISNRTLNYHFTGIVCRVLRRMKPPWDQEKALQFLAGGRSGLLPIARKKMRRVIAALCQHQHRDRLEDMMRRIPRRYHEDIQAGVEALCPDRE